VATYITTTTFQLSIPTLNEYTKTVTHCRACSLWRLGNVQHRRRLRVTTSVHMTKVHSTKCATRLLDEVVVYRLQYHFAK